jgi:hypothetical protein
VQFLLVASNGTAQSAPKQVSITVKPPPPAIAITAELLDTAQVLVDQNPDPFIYSYVAPVSKTVNIRWDNIAGASTTGVDFNGEPLGPSGTKQEVVKRRSEYDLSVIAQGTTPTRYTIRFQPTLPEPAVPQVFQPNPPIPPADLQVTAPVTFTWTYDLSQQVAQVVGFEIVRVLPALGPQPAIQVGANDRTWIDVGPSPLCDVSYFMRVLYLDLRGNTLLTSSSPTTWQNPPCP